MARNCWFCQDLRIWYPESWWYAKVCSRLDKILTSSRHGRKLLHLTRSYKLVSRILSAWQEIIVLVKSPESEKHNGRARNCQCCQDLRIWCPESWWHGKFCRRLARMAESWRHGNTPTILPWPPNLGGVAKFLLSWQVSKIMVRGKFFLRHVDLSRNFILLSTNCLPDSQLYVFASLRHWDHHIHLQTAIIYTTPYQGLFHTFYLGVILVDWSSPTPSPVLSIQVLTMVANHPNLGLPLQTHT